jgi:Concanavalin A-like lectin/glucanases superfamily
VAYPETIFGTRGLAAYWPMDDPSGPMVGDAFGSDDLIASSGVSFGGPPLFARGSGSLAFRRQKSGCATRAGSLASGSLTVEMWVRFDDMSTIRQCLWFNGSGNNGFGLILNGNGTNRGQLYLLQQNQAWHPLGYFPPSGVTIHLVLAYTAGSNNHRLYANGIQVLDFNFPALTNAPSGGFIIGAEAANGAGGFDGSMASVAIYATALDASTVVDHYSVGTWNAATRLATWERSVVDRHPTGAHPYDRHPADLAGTEHYDPLVCLMNGRDYFVRYRKSPKDWTVSIAAAVANWRDDYIFVANDRLPGYFHHTHGLARHYLMDPVRNVRSRDALAIIHPREWPGMGTEEGYRRERGYTFWQRETAFRLMGSLDYEASGLGRHMAVDWEADICLEYIDHFTTPPEERYGVFTRPFMLGLILRSLVYYWFTNRDSKDPTIAAIVDRIPPAVEAAVTHVMTNCWWPEGQVVPVAFTGDTWARGAIKYVHPHGGAASHAPIGGSTVQAVEGPTVFTGPASLSTIDGFYVQCQIGTATGQAWVRSYEGSTRRFVVVPLAGTNTFAPGTPFGIFPSGGDDGVGGFAPDSAIPVCNTLVSPAAAFAYWHRKVVMRDSAGAAHFRVHHEMLWEGQKMAWSAPFMQKEWNEGMLWGPLGIGYLAAGDAGTDTEFDSIAATATIPTGTPIEDDMTDYLALKAELALPAYAGKTDVEAAAILNGPGTAITRQRGVVSGEQVVASMNPTEFAALSAIQLQRMQLVLTPGQVDLKNDNIRAIFNDLFTNNASPITRAALTTLRTESVPRSRAEEIFGVPVTANDVAFARSL